MREVFVHYTSKQSLLGMVKRNFPRLDTARFNIIYNWDRLHSTTLRVLCTGMVKLTSWRRTNYIEKVQRKLVCGLKNKSFDERLRIIGLTTLVTRSRPRGDLINKIVHVGRKIVHHQFFLNLCRMVIART